MERAEEDRKQLCESPAWEELETGSVCLPILRSILGVTGFLGGGDGKATVPHRHSFAAITFLHLLEVWKKLRFYCVRRYYWNCCLDLQDIPLIKSAKLNFTGIPCIKRIWTMASSSPYCAQTFASHLLTGARTTLLIQSSVWNCPVISKDAPRMGARPVAPDKKWQGPLLKASSFLLFSSTLVGVASQHEFSQRHFCHQKEGSKMA